jgi:hypothetical protein
MKLQHRPHTHTIIRDFRNVSIENIHVRYQRLYADNPIDPQELPAEAVNTHSELPGQTAAHRFSELPARVMEPRELESPEVSPMPIQAEFAKDTTEGPTQGLGLDGAGGEK